MASLGTNYAHAAARETIRVGLVGCGGRGCGAAVNACEADPKVEIWTMGDLFPDHLSRIGKDENGKDADVGAKAVLKNAIAALDKGGKYNVADNRCFTGWDAYKQVLAQDIDYVILATPPGFRAMMIEAAIMAGKHIFAEKPVCVDPVGAQKIIALGELAAQKKLSLVAGTQRRHQDTYIETIKKVKEGAIGDIVAGWVYWMQGGTRGEPRKPEWSDVEYQIRNWPYFTWLSGDHIVEQHVHQVDVMNWIMGGPPKQALAMGGRQARTDPALYGHIYDHFAVEYEYAEGVRIMSMARQTEGAYGRQREQFAGTKGWCFPEGMIVNGATRQRINGNGVNPYVTEHADLIAAIRAGKPLNEAKTVAESCLTAIMGRISAYSGKLVTWGQVSAPTGMYGKLDLWPKQPLDFKMALPVQPVAIPGQPMPGMGK
jgi:predicted dehydrogenase